MGRRLANSAGAGAAGLKPRLEPLAARRPPYHDARTPCAATHAWNARMEHPTASTTIAWLPADTSPQRLVEEILPVKHQMT
eukprot:11218105-Lingulodinium_polyedra.AAC.1